MLTAEWNMDEAIAYVRKEAWEDGLQEGWGKRNFEIAQNALAKGYPLDMIHDITGLDFNVIESLQAEK